MNGRIELTAGVATAPAVIETAGTTGGKNILAGNFREDEEEEEEVWEPYEELIGMDEEEEVATHLESFYNLNKIYQFAAFPSSPTRPSYHQHQHTGPAYNGPGRSLNNSISEPATAYIQNLLNLSPFLFPFPPPPPNHPKRNSVGGDSQRVGSSRCKRVSLPSTVHRIDDNHSQNSTIRKAISKVSSAHNRWIPDITLHGGGEVEVEETAVPLYDDSYLSPDKCNHRPTVSSRRRYSSLLPPPPLSNQHHAQQQNRSISLQYFPGGGIITTTTNKFDCSFQRTPSLEKLLLIT